MSEDGIFLVKNENLIVLERTPYESEAILQQALESFPEVLAGGATVAGDRSGLLLVRREMGIPKSEGASATWSIDHLFLDSGGIPVLVEVKRSSDTRIRREVVGQMLDYAANGVRYWPVSDLRDAVEREADAKGQTGEELVHITFRGVDPEEYWEQVGDNLSAGRIRMVFVADRLPPELIRVIEFLNEQMQPAEVLGVEVVQYVAADHQVLVPRLVGRTSAAIASKQQAGGTPWTRATFLEQVEIHLGPKLVDLYEQLFDHCDAHGSHMNFGKGQSPGVSAWYAVGGGSAIPTWISATGTAAKTPNPTFSFYFDGIRDRLSEERFDQFLEFVGKIEAYLPTLEPAIQVNFDKKWPNLPLLPISDDPIQQAALLEAIDEVVREPTLEAS